MATLTTTARKSSRPARKPFGVGILRSLPAHRVDCTLADLEWAAQQNAEVDQAWWTEEARREEDLMLDRLGREYEAQMRIEQGLDA